MIYGSTKTVVGGIIYMLYLKTSVKNGIISLYPLNPDEMYYKCEVCGNFYGIDNLSDFSFDENESFYIGKSKAGLKLNQSAQNPITYLNPR